MQSVKVQVPATTANLGPGFDVLALALDLWNEVEITVGGEGIRVEVAGEGKDELPTDEQNLIAMAVSRIYKEVSVDEPRGIVIKCINRIPLGSGLGSSSAAVVAGLLGGNALLGNPLTKLELFQLTVEMEGHADNAAAALFGGLTMVWQHEDEDRWAVQRVTIKPMQVQVVLPDITLSTQAARAAIPEQFSKADTIYNLGRVAPLVEAFRIGDLEMLRLVMTDKLHQQCRFALIPGSQEAVEAARGLGAAAAISGAGPSIVAFVEDAGSQVMEAMQTAFANEGVRSRTFSLAVSNDGAKVDVG